MEFINEMRRIARDTTFEEFKTAVDNMDLHQLDDLGFTDGNFLLIQTIKGLEIPGNDVEQKVHYLLEKGVNPRLGRSIASPIVNAILRKNNDNVDTVSRIIRDLVSHGAILGNEEINLASYKKRFSKQTINEWKTHVGEGEKWLETMEKMSTPEGRKDLQWESRKGRIMLEAGVDAAYKANVPGSQEPQSHIEKYLLNSLSGRELDTYIGLPGDPRERGGKRRSKKNRKGKTKRRTTKRTKRTKRTRRN